MSAGRAVAGRPRYDIARIGLVGAGGIGRAHAEAAAGLDHATVVAVADVMPTAARELAARYGARVMAVEELSDPAFVDLVIVACPPASHPMMVEPLLRAGVPVLCEKPLAVHAKAAAELAQLSSETGTPLYMATKFRFVADVAQTRSMIAAGELGQVLKIEVSFAGQVDMSSRWNSDPEISGGGVLIDNATHGIDLVRHVAGEIVEVMAVRGAHGQAVTVEDSATLLARMETGATAQVDVTWSFRRLAPTYLTVLGDAGTVEVGWSGGRALTSNRTEPFAFGTGYRKIDSLRENVAAVLAALADEGPQPVTAADALATSLVVDAGYASIRDGRWVPIEDTFR